MPHYDRYSNNENVFVRMREKSFVKLWLIEVGISDTVVCLGRWASHTCKLLLYEQQVPCCVHMGRVKRNVK